MKKIILIALFFLTQLVVAQQNIKGTIIDKETNAPLQDVTVLDIHTQKWAITDVRGNFELKHNGASDATLNFRILGKQERTIHYKSQDLQKALLITLEDKNLRLDEIVVSAKKGKDYSEIAMQQEAIQQVQAFSLNEVLEQVPGQAVTNFSLNDFKPIAFRTVRPQYVSDNSFTNKSFGTAVVLDGIPISNNENMQSYSANSGSSALANFNDESTSAFNDNFNNANYGTDLREVAVENIEKIEIVQGVPSAKYGDLTSGLVKITQKAGKSKYKVYTSLRDGTQEYGFTKGFELSPKAGHLNASVNYLKSNSEPRVSYTQYERISTNLMWTWMNKNKNIKNSVSFDYAFNGDNVNYEEEDTDNKIVENSKKEFGFSDRLRWSFDHSFIDNLEFNANFKYAKQLSYESKYINIGGNIVGNSLVEDVYTGEYTPVGYNAVKRVEGIPLSGFASLDLSKYIQTENWEHSISVGTSLRFSDNLGRGRLGTSETLSNFYGSTAGNGGAGFRPYNFGDSVKSEYQFSVYAEDNIIRRWENSLFNFNAGLRYDNQYGSNFIAPRINAFYEQKQFKVRGGFGLTSKAPSINQIFTGTRYHDVVLADIRYPGFYNIGVVQTFINKADNLDLKPSKSMRSELGFDYNFPFGSFNITGFYNKLYDGITSQSVIQNRDIATLDIQYNGTTAPTYEISGYKNYYFSNSYLNNMLESQDLGLELFLNFKKLPIKNLNLDINGSYIKTTNLDKNDSFQFTKDTSKEETYGILKGYERTYTSLRFGGNLSYHMPKIGLVLSLRSEHFIIDQNKYNPTVNPYAYLDKNLVRHEIPADQIGDQNLWGHITSTGSPSATKNQKVYNNFHLRLSKDFQNGFRFSFYANNFLDLKPTENTLSNGVTYERQKANYVKLSFGTKIEYNF